MDIHRQIYSHLIKLIPILRSLEVRKDPYLIELAEHCPINVHLELQEGKEILTLAIFPHDEAGHIVPLPYIDLELDHENHLAIPRLYVNGKNKMQRNKIACRDEASLDFAVSSWLNKFSCFRFQPSKNSNRSNIPSP